MLSRERQKLQHVDGNTPELPGIRWTRKGWPIMSVDAFIDILRYAVDQTEYKADMMFNLIKNSHKLDSDQFQETRTNVERKRAKVIALEECISRIFDMMMDTVGTAETVFWVTSPMHQTTDADVEMTRGTYFYGEEK
jgi:hypothetical protein